MNTTSKIRVLYITRAFGSYQGGMERLSFEFVQALKSDPTLEIKVLAHQGKRISSPFFMLKVLPQALWKARSADVIHLGDPFLSKIGWLIKLIFHKPVVVTVHGLDIVYSHPVYRLYLWLFFGHFDRYIAISQHVKDLLAHRVPTQRIEVIPPSITDEYYDPTKTREHLSLVIHQTVTDKVVLLTVGRLVKRKGHVWFIKNVLPKLPSHVLYVIAGDGPEYEAIKKSAEKNRLAERVILLGKVSTETLTVLYNTVDAFIQPNILMRHDVEGFGLVLLEATLCERPVFAARIDGLPEAIQNNYNGTLLPAQDAPAWINALAYFIQQPAMNFNPRLYTLDNFSWKKRIPRYHTLYRSL